MCCSVSSPPACRSGGMCIRHRVAVRCRVVQCAAEWAQCDAVCCSLLQFVAVCCSMLQCVAVCCSALQLDRGVVDGAMASGTVHFTPQEFGNEIAQGVLVGGSSLVGREL